jgi:hypothetical protein
MSEKKVNWPWEAYKFLGYRVSDDDETDKLFQDFVEGILIKERDSKEKIISAVKEWKNPYPKDVFEWNNSEKFKLLRGRFNEVIYTVVENTRNSIIKEIENEKNDN